MTATITLALGIGLSTAVYTVADALLLRRLPVGDQDRLVVLWGETRDGQFSNFPLALDDIREFELRSRSVEHVAFFAFRGATLTPIRADDRVLPVRTALVSGNFFDVLRSRPAIGRTFRPEDDVVGAAPVLVLSHRAWQQHFGGDSAIIGRSIAMIQTGRSYAIVGVMPRGLEYPRGTDVWAPLTAYSAAGGFLDIISGELDMLARLRPGASPAQARAELTSFLGRPEAPAWHRDVRGVVHTLPDIVLGETKPALLVITLAAALLLLITSVNVANLLLVRALGRAREFVVRSALGANRGRIAVQLLTESGLLSIVGGLLGVGFAVATVRTFVALAPDNVPRLDEIGINVAALVAALLITAAVMLLSGLAPTLFASRVNADDVLRSGSRQSGGRRARAAAEMLVVAQVALAAMTLAAAGLMTRSLINLVQVDLLFDPRQLLVADLALRQDQLDDTRKQQAALDLLLPRLEALPGVRAVSPVLTVPFSGAGGGIDGRLSTPGQSQAESAGNPMLNIEIVAPNYFATLGIPLLHGRTFSEEDRDGSGPVVILSSSAARHFWPSDDPIGKRVRVPGSEATVVGVVPDTRYRELQTARPSVYFPVRQSQFPVVPATLLIRTSDSPADLVPALRRAVAEAHPGVTLASASSLEVLLDAPRAQPRLNAMVLALFASAAVSLAAIGLFAVITTMVRQRTRELGIRMALGATATDVRRMVLFRGIMMAAVGTVVGIVGALATSRMLSALLFEISPTDGPTLVLVAALMLGLAAIASSIPARSSMRIDPAIALRSET
ncbi:MAG: ABC transporter permease [Gemmatimonadota bacterium]|nr:ABC transporter permease [Gemmatimonadota bacterium]